MGYLYNFLIRMHTTKIIPAERNYYLIMIHLYFQVYYANTKKKGEGIIIKNAQSYHL
jgi:hypothetical protein